MRCEVIAIGTELLLGIIVDSNSAWIGEQLALAGIDSYFQVKVGDNFGRIEGCIRQALERSDAVICCGGLGPTQDDITRDVIARVMGVEMRRDPAIAAKIRHMFESRGRIMSENNLHQADIPIGAAPIAEMPGTAPGLVCPVGNKVIYATPGVPHEMHEMFLGTILPDLRRRAGQAAVIKSRVLRTWGMSESGLAEVLQARFGELDKLGTPTIAFQASGIDGIKVRIVAKCDDEASAVGILDAEEALIRGLLGTVVFGVDNESMESVVLEALRKKGLTFAAAETITGGLLSARMSAVDPAMEVYRGGRVGLEQGATAGSQPEQRAAAAASQVRLDFAARVGLAAIAPNAAEDYRPGTVFLAADIDGVRHGECVMQPADRRRMREFSVISLLNLLRRTLSAWGGIASMFGRDRGLCKPLAWTAPALPGIPPAIAPAHRTI
ncbi:MAG: CinA family nicotinamide mononucleotide deamidase-related protein [Hyphomicrobiaceae bacterium]|nr:CinA family nicotinamide mononucleotide deamidase-related protein [Hyphomicrobiaceae bacterium]